MKHISKKARAEALRDLTDNGKKRKMVRELERLMSNPEDLKMLNALFSATREIK